MKRKSRMITPQWGYQNGDRLNPAWDLRWQLRLILESVKKDDEYGQDNCDRRNYVACQAYDQIRESCIADNFGDLDILEMLHEEVEHLI
jgi:hypothetical protein|tara:strand:- start:624 stop:890 length:267 start_codon:yes stop_codon:yes gene_type:complete